MLEMLSLAEGLAFSASDKIPSMYMEYFRFYEDWTYLKIGMNTGNRLIPIDKRRHRVMSIYYTMRMLDLVYLVA